MSNDFFKNYFFPCKRKTFPHIGAYKTNLKSYRSDHAERRHWSSRVADHAFLVWRSSWRCFVCSNRSAPDRDKWCGPSRTKSHPAGSFSSSQTGGPPCWASPLVFGLIGSDHRVHTEWQWPLPGVHSIMMEKSAQPAEDKGCTLHAPSPFHSIYHHKQSCGVPSSWEGRYTPPISPLPLYVTSGSDSMLLRGVNVDIKNYSSVRWGCVMKLSFYITLHQTPPKFPRIRRDCLNF